MATPTYPQRARWLLQHAVRDQGFYGAIARATIALIRELRTSDSGT